MSSTSTVIVLIMAFALISGCDEGGNLGQEGSAFWHKRTSYPDKVKFFSSACRAYGFKEGSDAFSNCIASEIRRSEDAARSRMRSATMDYDTPAVQTQRSKDVNYPRTVICNTYGNRSYCF